MDLFAPRHLLIILVIALVVFGGKKLKTLGSDLGGAVKGFKQAMKDGENEDHATPAAAATPTQPSQHELSGPSAASATSAASEPSSTRAA